MDMAALTSYISRRGLGGRLDGAFLVIAAKTPMIHLLVPRFKPVYYVERDIVEGVEAEVIYLDSSVFEKDVRDGAFGEAMAARLLLPIMPFYGEDRIRELELQYKMNVIRQLLRDLVSEHKIASLELRIRPEYFLFEKVRRLATVFPRFRRYFLECYSSDRIRSVVDGYVKAAEKLLSEGLLQNVEGYYTISKQAYEEFSNIPPIIPSRLSGQLREYLTQPLMTKAALRVFFNTAGEFVKAPIPPITSLPDPESYISINTAKGIQSLTFQLEVDELVKHLYGDARAEIRRKGGALNSTYELTIYADVVHKLFVKKYLNWTDLKWIAARIWAAWVKNFSINPSSRLATEVFYLERLRSMGFRTPEVVHVNWRRKILFTTYLEGKNLLELWLQGDAERERFAQLVGSCLARIHANDVTIGDCKPETFMRVMDELYVTDLEQASFSGDRSWDLMELIYYPGHYLNVDEAIKYARHIVEGYLSEGEANVVRDALKPKYLRVISPWTPVWVQRSITETVRSCLRA